MGTGMCSRRQKGLLQTGFCLVAVACLGAGVFMYSHLQQKAKNAEALALKFKQQHEALSAQLQVVYEHRSRLERSLQKERGEHKKTKEDFLVYKLEAQEALNKEKQDSMNRYGALSSQHKILKNQHEDVKKQLLDLQLQHNSLKLEHRKTVETHSQKYAQLQREKESEVTGLQDTVFKLREESKLLRQAHQDVHSQLLDAQTQMEEFRQLKEALQKMPSFKEVGPAKGQEQLQALKEQPPVPGSNHLQFSRQKVFAANGAKMLLSSVDQEKPPGGSLMRPQISGVRSQGEGTLPQGQTSHNSDGPRPQSDVLFAHPAPLQEANPPPAALPARPQGHGDSPVIRFTRTVNSVQNGNSDHKVVMSIQGKTSEENHAPRGVVPNLKRPSTLEKEAAPVNHPSAGNKPARMQSWQDIVNKVNARMDEEQVHGYPKHLHFDTRSEQNGNLLLANQQRGAEHPIANREGDKEGTDDEELEMDAGMIEREENMHTQKEVVVQEPMMPDDAADPAQDPNNQGEDEFEEAELERPDFEEKVVQSDKYKDPSVLGKEETKKPLKGAAGPDKAREEPMDDYQEDQEQEIEDHGGEVDDNDDLELVQEHKDRGGVPGAESKKDDYY
ncbi:Golgi integral membrane protein 4-like isoform X2 [Chrysemys picta bellii]|uniref:Golgi integral membrane protein 4-like isoform X2 n=1 Tax=Chrysemys picta bellii TaxID=8478 RepID=UPI0032B26131